MKKIIISLILSLVVSTVATQSSQAQITLTKPSNQYPGSTGTITMSDYIYKYRNRGVNSNRIELYNAVTSYFDTEWGHKDGTPLTPEEAAGLPFSYYYSYRSHTTNELRAIVEACFTSEQKAAIKGNSLVIDAPVNPSTGKIEDVYFRFDKNSSFMNIPIETFRSIELTLKQKVTVKATSEGKKMNYFPFLWRQDF